MPILSILPNNFSMAIERGVEATEKGTPALLEFIPCQETDISVF